MCLYWLIFKIFSYPQLSKLGPKLGLITTDIKLQYNNEHLVLVLSIMVGLSRICCSHGL